MSKPIANVTIQNPRIKVDQNSCARRFVLAFLFVSLLAACSASREQPEAPAPKQNKAALVEELETAEREDWNNALDPRVAPSEREDFLDQMNKANRAIRELTHGFEVPEAEVDDALVMPPKSLSAARRLLLIRRLQDAVRQDDHNEQAMLNDLAWSDSAFPADTAKFDQQKELANEVIKDLEIGEDVHWSTIGKALVVPQSPY
jgi:hypothetical protein